MQNYSGDFLHLGRAPPVHFLASIVRPRGSPKGENIPDDCLMLRRVY